MTEKSEVQYFPYRTCVYTITVYLREKVPILKLEYSLVLTRSLPFYYTRVYIQVHHIGCVIWLHTDFICER